MNDTAVDRPAPRRGWSSQHLPVVAVDDERYWSVFDMTEIFGVNKKKVLALIELANLKHIGKRHSGAKKRHVPVYLARDVLDATEEKVAKLLSSSSMGQENVPAAELPI